MKIVTREVYYCEFCSKHLLTKGPMSRHEKHCTGNPDRHCRVCGRIGNLPHVPALPELSLDDPAALTAPWDDKEYQDILKYFVDRLMEDLDCCFMCTFAALPQSGTIGYYPFDYKKERDSYWRDFNEEQRAVAGY